MFLGSKQWCQDLVLINKKLKALRDKQYRENEAQKRMGLTKRQVLIIVAVYVLSNYSVPICQEVFLRFQRNKSKIEKPIEPDLIREWFIEAPEDLVYGPNQSQKHALICKDAARLVAEVQSVLWVKHQNFERDVAPSSHALINNFKVKAESLGHPELADAVVASANLNKHSMRRTARRWVRRFRDRWMVNRGCLPCLEKDANPQLLNKVACLQNCFLLLRAPLHLQIL